MTVDLSDALVSGGINAASAVTIEESVRGAKNQLTASRSSVRNDDCDVLSNSTTSNFTLTVQANTLTEGIVLQQLSTGTVTVAAGAGVTFIGTSLSTSAAGQMIAVISTPTPNTFIVKLSS